LINRIKGVANTEEKKRLLSNFFSLAVLQGANYVLPLITLPYLVRVLGVEYFGLLAFATAFIMYFQIIADYGFNLTATREISIHRNNHTKITEIFSAVMSIKILLTLVSFLLMTLIVFSFEKFAKDWEIYFLTFGMVIGQTLFPVWFFQGMERMKYITYLNILAKSIFTVAIFVFVKQESDYYIVPILNSLGFIIAGIWSLYLIRKEFSIKFQFQRMERLRFYLVDGWHVFISNISISLYMSTNTFILGLLTNNMVVGYYSAFEKIVRAVTSLYTPIYQVFFPYVIKRYKVNKMYAHKIINKLLITSFASSVVLFSLISFFSDLVVSILLGKEYLPYMNTFHILTLLVIVLPSAYVIFNLALLMMKYDKIFMRLYLFGGFVNLFNLYIFVYTYQMGADGTALSLLITEIIITLIAISIYFKGKR